MTTKLIGDELGSPPPLTDGDEYEEEGKESTAP